ncbi:inactive peptidyl-prolyl cis-trans isomerase FKBP6-like isoform X2 [Haliotis cracherodii]|uniref:inactive peptidyl-prolyl cis-trans isomerase FKBP6-like isoform X2 n=1 Tax=Haliotis cracherodii TaxID=6455 RepID=UPI0039E7D48D
MSADLQLEADDMAVRLEEGIDLNDLRQSKEVILSLAEDQEQERNQDLQLDNDYFDPEDVLQNVLPEGEFDSDESESLFVRMGRNMHEVTGDGGVMKKILTQGVGSNLAPDALVRVHYNGYLEDAIEPFDSSRLRKTVKKFRLNKGEVFTGFDLAVNSMKKGELSRFLIKPEYAFGAMGCPPRIPADATLMYEIQLLSFVEKEGVDDYYSMTDEERRMLSFPKLRQVANSEKQEGNEYYRVNNFRRAVGKYRMAVRIIEDAHLKDYKEQQEQRKLLLKLYLNLALCCEKLGEVKHALYNCANAYRIEPKNAKVLYHYGKSYRMDMNFNMARSYLERAQRLQPNDSKLNHEIQELNKYERQCNEIEKETCRRMFSQPTGVTEDPAVEEAKRKARKKEECSPDFRKSVYGKLRELKEDTSIDELPMTTCQLSQPEISCILEIAEELDLDPVVRGTGQSAHMVVKKKKS